MKSAQKRGKARKMWFPDHTPSRRGYISVSYHKPPAYQKPNPVFVLPAAPKDVERMKTAIAKSIYFKTSAGITWSDPAGNMHRKHCLFMAGEALRTLGILTPTKKA